MNKKLIALFLLVMPMVVTAQGEATKGAGNTEAAAPADGAPKLLTGISVVGNDEAPKSLYIVSWKTSEGSMLTDLNSSLLNEGMSAVDKEVFLRQLDFYEISKAE